MAFLKLDQGTLGCLQSFFMEQLFCKENCQCVLLVVLGIEHSTSHVQGKCSTPESHPQHSLGDPRQGL